MCACRGVCVCKQIFDNLIWSNIMTRSKIMYREDLYRHEEQGFYVQRIHTQGCQKLDRQRPHSQPETTPPRKRESNLARKEEGLKSVKTTDIYWTSQDCDVNPLDPASDPKLLHVTETDRIGSKFDNQAEEHNNRLEKVSQLKYILHHESVQ